MDVASGIVGGSSSKWSIVEPRAPMQAAAAAMPVMSPAVAPVAVAAQAVLPTALPAPSQAAAGVGGLATPVAGGGGLPGDQILYRHVAAPKGGARKGGKAGKGGTDGAAAKGGGKTVTVEKGDTLAKIAKEHHVSKAKLQKLNKSVLGTGSSRVVEGQVLTLDKPKAKGKARGGGAGTAK